jgi:hypothetical protein
VHLDAALPFVVARYVIELREIEIGVQLPVDARQQILIERGRDACRIVVSEEQL